MGAAQLVVQSRSRAAAKRYQKELQAHRKFVARLAVYGTGELQKEAMRLTLALNKAIEDMKH